LHDTNTESRLVKRGPYSLGFGFTALLR